MTKTNFYAFGAAIVLAGMTSMASAAVVANFTFETSVPTTAGPIAAEVGVGTASTNTPGGTFVGVISNPAGNAIDATASIESFSSNGWDVGEYFQFAVPTTGFEGITVGFDVTGSNTGPGSFSFQYSTNGTTFTEFATYTVTNQAWNTSLDFAESAKFFDLSTITAANNNALFVVRMVDNSTTSINGGTVATGGTSRIDNVVFSGTAVPEPTTLAALAGMGLVALRRRRA